MRTLGFVGLCAVTCLSLWSIHASAQETSTYSYDAQGRLSQSAISGGPRNGQSTVTCFDRAGNRTAYTVATSPASCPASGAVFYTGSIPAATDLYPNQYVISADGRFKLIYQTNGNLVLYMNGSTVLWSSGTSGTTVSKASFTSDGQLYIGSAYWVWSPPTVFTGPYGRLQVQNDGNVVAYDGNNTLIWQTNTCCH